MLKPERGNRLQWGPAAGAGLVTGIVLMLIPRGSPWAGVSFFSSVVMGRPVPAMAPIPLPLACLLHLAIAEFYGLVVSICVTHIKQLTAMITGGAIGLLLYLANLLIVSVALPAWRGNEISVLFTHVVFGLIAGAAYRGLLRRRRIAAPSSR